MTSVGVASSPIHVLRKSLRGCDVSTVLDEVLVFLFENEVSFGCPLTLLQARYHKMLRAKLARELTKEDHPKASAPIPVHVMDVAASDMRAVHVSLLELQEEHAKLALESIERDQRARDLEDEVEKLRRRNTALELSGMSNTDDARVVREHQSAVAALQHLNAQMAEEYEILRRNVECGFVMDAQELLNELERRKHECDGLAATNTLLASALLQLQEEMKELRNKQEAVSKELDLQQRRANLAEKELREHRAAAESNAS
jgi:hypothetical protein